MRGNGKLARSSRGRTIIRTEAAIAGAAPRRGKGIGARGSRGGRGAATAPRGRRGAAIASRGARVRRLEFIENDDEFEGDGDDDEAQEESEDEGHEENKDEGQENEDEAQEENEDEAEVDDGDLWLRGPAGLPTLPSNEHEKWVIEPFRARK